MMINALNSGATGFMADLEDSLSPTWDNVVLGQANLTDAIDGSIDFTSDEGKQYALGQDVAVLIPRPRGWHLHEKHATLDGEPLSASLFDFGLYAFRNARTPRRQAGGAVPLPPEDGEPPRGAAVERRLPLRPVSSSTSTRGRSRPRC